MDWRLRFLPLGLVVVLFTLKAFNSDFLGERIWPQVPLSWFWVILTPLSTLAAYLITPSFVHLVTRMAKRGIIIPAIFIALAVGLLWFVDLAYNSTVGAWCDSCPDSHILATFTSIFGGD